MKNICIRTAYAGALLIALCMAVVMGCGAGRRGVFEESLSRHAHIAVMPLRNDTNDVDGPAVVQEKMAAALARRGYVVRGLESTKRVLSEQFGVTLGGQADGVDIRQLGEALGVDAVLYGTLMDFNETTTGAYNVRKVRAKFRLVSASTGQVLWGRGLGVRSEQVLEGGGGLAATALGRISDPRDKEAPWVTIEHVAVGRSYQESLAIGLGTKLLAKALRIHLEREAEALSNLMIEDLRWVPLATQPAGGPQAP